MICNKKIKNGKHYYDLKYKETEEFFKNRPEWMQNYDNDIATAAFIRGLISEFKPKNMLEIGTAAGWAATYIINEAIKYDSNATLTSIDLFDVLYYNKTKKVGSALEEKFPNYKEHWDLRLGKYTLDSLEELDKKYDFVFIDASHNHPWATFDFLAVLPYLEKNAIVIIHDVFLNHILLKQLSGERHPKFSEKPRDINRGPNVLYNCLKDKMVMAYDTITANASAIMVEDKEALLSQLLHSLSIIWEKMFTDNVYGDKTKPYTFMIQNVEFIRKHFGDTWAEKFMKVIYERFYFGRY